MGTGSFTKTDLYAIHNIVQNTMLSYAKELVIEVLRDEFSKDSYYHFVKDEWGFPFRPDHTDMDITAGLHDDLTSRIFIGEAFGYDQKLYPAILVRSGSMRYVPISFNRNDGVIQYTATRVLDGYGNEKIFSTPAYVKTAGAWEGSLTIDVYAGDIKARDDLLEIIAAILTITNFKSLTNAGVIVKPVSIGSPSEVDDARRKIYKESITCDIRTEWKQQIPIDSVVNAISFCIDFGNLNESPPALAPNLEARSIIELIEDL